MASQNGHGAVVKLLQVLSQNDMAVNTDVSRCDQDGVSRHRMNLVGDSLYVRVVGSNVSSPIDHRLIKVLVHPESGPLDGNGPHSIDGWVLGLRAAFLDELSQLGLQWSGCTRLQTRLHQSAPF
jgi:hypothetical protein